MNKDNEININSIKSIKDYIDELEKKMKKELNENIPIDIPEIEGDNGD